MIENPKNKKVPAKDSSIIIAVEIGGWPLSSFLGQFAKSRNLKAKMHSFSEEFQRHMNSGKQSDVEDDNLQSISIS